MNTHSAPLHIHIHDHHNNHTPSLLRTSPLPLPLLLLPLQRMPPNLLLQVFLPIIGFSAAMGQEPHHLRKSWAQVRGEGDGMMARWDGFGNRL